VEFFLAVILGLGLGHTLLNTSAMVGDSIDPCCVEVRLSRVVVVVVVAGVYVYIYK